ncbi:MAG: 5'/3'-nucleotidase SurE [Alphaproteobacteria bacterium]|nr:5'/3'-nucleotidase SurE [Alphaproteobacteria bacterium]
MGLAGARILVTNDDGIHAPGLKVLETIARTLSRDVWVVAPESEQSASGHSLTLTGPLRIRRISERRFAVNGTPTDSVLLAIKRIVRGKAPELVLSGVNSGGNLGEDITYSGTVAAAMEGTLLGIPAIALSQMRRSGHPIHWGTAAEHGAAIVERLCAAGFPRNVLINVNFPDVAAHSVAGIRVTRQGRRKVGDMVTDGVDPRGHAYVWIGADRDEDASFAGSDLAAVNAGAISVTPLCLDLTHRPTMAALKRLFP